MNVTIGGHTIDTASKEQLESTRQMIDKQLAELNKPKQYVFKEGDFILSYSDKKPMLYVTNESIKWSRSFAFLSYHCLKLGGRVMSKPSYWNQWWHPFYSFRDKTWDALYVTHFTTGVFHFDSKETCKQFLSTEGIQTHLMNFFQIEH